MTRGTYMKTVFAALALIGATAATAETKSIKVVLKNSLGAGRADVPVVVQLKDIPFAVKDALVKDGTEEVPSQLDDIDENNRNDELAFVTNMAANSTKTLTVELYSEKQAERNYTPRTYGDLILRNFKSKDKNEAPYYIKSLTVHGTTNPYSLVQHHGADFESELVGYRVYFDERQTFDLYGKMHKRLELKDCQFYPSKEQLADGFGDDVLWVGKTVGLGALRGWDGKQPTMVSPVEFRGQRVVASGPVRTIVEVKDDRWQYGGTEITMTQHIIIYAGHRDCEIQVRFDRKLPEMKFSTGVINLKDKSYSDHKGLIGTWGANWPNGAKDSIAGKPKVIVGLAVNVPQSLVAAEPADTTEQYLYVIDAKDRQSFTYHIAFTSGKEIYGFDGARQWFDWMRRWKREIDNPVTVKVML